MIERWLIKGRVRGGVWGGKFLRKAGRVAVGAWILSLAFLLAGARPFWNHFHQPDAARLDAIADEVGSIGFMIQGHRAWWFAADPPLINHAGTEVLYCQTSENGAALFRTDLATGERKQLFEELGSRFSAGPATVLTCYSWSPDDAKVVYTRRGQTDAWVMVVAEAATGRELAALNISRVEKTVWLSPASFVCVERSGDLHLIEEQPGGDWQEAETISIGARGAGQGQLRLQQPPRDGKLKRTGTISINGRYDGLAAWSSDTLVWQETNQIVSLNLPAKTAEVMFKLAGGALKGFSYSRETGQFLLSCTGKGQDSLWRLTPGEETLQETNLIATVKANVSRWLPGGQGWVYFNQDRQLLVQTNVSAEPVKVLEHGRIGSFAETPDGRHLVIFGTAGNEPASGIWEYDVTANTARCVAPAAEHGLQHVITGMRTQHHLIPVRAGGWFDLNIYKPIPFDRHRRYPVVVANTPASGAEPYLAQYALAVENAGAYFVDLDRRDWADNKGTQDAWADNEAQVINLLAQDPTIDRRRMVLISNCVESRWLGLYAAKYPWRCQGMFMLVGNQLPEPAILAAGQYPVTVFDSACDAWEGKGERLDKYQETAAGSGVAMDYQVHPNTQHDFVGQQAQRERLRALLHLVFDN
jgi:dienelactone hydrolase